MNLRDCLVRHGIINSRIVCRLPIAVQLFFRNLLHTCDGAGRFEAEADELRIALYQHALDRVSRLHVSRWLAECHRAALVRLYTGPDGRGYGEVLKYGQLDRKRRIIHPARETDQLALAVNLGASSVEDQARSSSGPVEGADPPAPDPLELNRREKKSPQPPPKAGAGEEESFPVRYFSDRLGRTMCELEGSDPQKLTMAGKRAIMSAISAIQRVKADLHPDDLENAASVWKRIFPTASLTARAMATHWAKLNGPAAGPVKPKPLVEEEPFGWRDWINENTPDTKYARGGEAEGTPWHDLPGEYRRYLIEKLTRRPAA